jgi:hypothetical protein
LKNYNNLEAVNSQIMIPDMWHQRSLTGLLAQDISHMRQCLIIGTDTCGTIEMAPNIYHRRDEMIYIEKEIAHMITHLRLSTDTCGTRDMAPEIYHRIDETV